MLFIHPVSLAIVIYRFPPMSSITSSLPSDRGGGGSQSIQDLTLDQSNKHLTMFNKCYMYLHNTKILYRLKRWNIHFCNSLKARNNLWSSLTICCLKKCYRQKEITIPTIFSPSILSFFFKFHVNHDQIYIHIVDKP